MRPLVVPVAAGLCLVPAVANAGGDGISFSLYALGGAAQIDERTLHVALSADEPPMLASRELAMDGWGRMAGGGMRLALLGDSDSIGRFRYGLGLGVADLGGLELIDPSGPLPEGHHLELGEAFVMKTELLFGREFFVTPEEHSDLGVPRRAFYPYVDVFVAFELVAAEVQIHSATLGLLGKTDYQGYGLAVGPRAGVCIPLSTDIYADLGVYGSVIGTERIGGYVGLGLWDR